MCSLVLVSRRRLSRWLDREELAVGSQHSLPHASNRSSRQLVTRRTRQGLNVHPSEETSTCMRTLVRKPEREREGGRTNPPPPSKVLLTDVISGMRESSKSSDGSLTSHAKWLLLPVHKRKFFPHCANPPPPCSPTGVTSPTLE